MMIANEIRRPLGTMIVYGIARSDLEVDLGIADRLGAEVLEILPDWRTFPNPGPLRARIEERGLRIHSAHGCWGGQSIKASRVDLGSTDPRIWSESLDDLKRCVDWLELACGACLVIHPGGLSEPKDFFHRRAALTLGLRRLAAHAEGPGVTLCVENMPPGVAPGSRMADLFEMISEIDHPRVALALDTGHAHISGTVAGETVDAGTRLRTTHVHDNDARHDTHLPPGLGSIDWAGWIASLDAIRYEGPILLECIKFLRERPEALSPEFLARLRKMTGLER